MIDVDKDFIHDSLRLENLCEYGSTANWQPNLSDDKFNRLLFKAISDKALYEKQGVSAATALNDCTLILSRCYLKVCTKFDETVDNYKVFIEYFNSVPQKRREFLSRVKSNFSQKFEDCTKEEYNRGNSNSYRMVQNIKITELKDYVTSNVCGQLKLAERTALYRNQARFIGETLLSEAPVSPAPEWIKVYLESRELNSN